MSRHLVLLQSHSNQRFIFESPRLREIIGASELITRLPLWAESVPGAPQSSPNGRDPWIVKSSGRVVVEVDSESTARSMIRDVTRRALLEAPGLEVSGVFTDIREESLQDSLTRLDQLALTEQLDGTPRNSRFGMLPFLQRGNDSSRPASKRLKGKAGVGDYSLTASVKRQVATAAKRNLLATVALRAGLEPSAYEMPLSVDELERLFEGDDAQTDQEPRPDESALPKVAVIHIDGNGVGAIMRNLSQSMDAIPAEVWESEIGCRSEEDQAAQRFMRAVSQRMTAVVLDSCAKAFEKVSNLATVKTDKGVIVPLVPVLLGGDDVTMIADGRLALTFASEYLLAYEEYSGTDRLLSRLPTTNASDQGPLTASAGVAIVRRNFPFHIAYELAEELCARGKKVAKDPEHPCSTINFHMLFDTTILDPVELLNSTKRLTKRPYRMRFFDAFVNGDDGHPTWNQMVDRTAVFAGEKAAPAAKEAQVFPKTRATRIRRCLAEGNQELAREHWELARSELQNGEQVCKAIGGYEYIPDLLELVELLPKSVLRGRSRQDHQAGDTSPSPAEGQ